MELMRQISLEECVQAGTERQDQSGSYAAKTILGFLNEYTSLTVGSFHRWAPE
jgi:hypothetical protein